MTKTKADIAHEVASESLVPVVPFLALAHDRPSQDPSPLVANKVKIHWVSVVHEDFDLGVPNPQSSSSVVRTPDHLDAGVLLHSVYLSFLKAAKGHDDDVPHGVYVQHGGGGECLVAFGVGLCVDEVAHRDQVTEELYAHVRQDHDHDPCLSYVHRSKDHPGTKVRPILEPCLFLAHHGLAGQTVAHPCHH